MFLTHAVNGHSLLLALTCAPETIFVVLVRVCMLHDCTCAVLTPAIPFELVAAAACSCLQCLMQLPFNTSKPAVAAACTSPSTLLHCCRLGYE
jgi:hypothetical protein